MVAVESVFTKSVSRALTRTARRSCISPQKIWMVFFVWSNGLRAPESPGRPEPKRKLPKIDVEAPELIGRAISELPYLGPVGRSSPDFNRVLCCN